MACTWSTVSHNALPSTRPSISSVMNELEVNANETLTCFPMYSTRKQTFGRSRDLSAACHRLHICIFWQNAVGHHGSPHIQTTCVAYTAEIARAASEVSVSVSVVTFCADRCATMTLINQTAAAESAQDQRFTANISDKFVRCHGAERRASRFHKISSLRFNYLCSRFQRSFLRP